MRKGEKTEEEIKLLKAKFGKVSEVEVEDEGEKYVGYFRRPSMDTISAVTAESKHDEVKALEVMFANCWLGGAEEIEQDAIIKIAAMTQLSGLMGQAVGRLKNL